MIRGSYSLEIHRERKPGEPQRLTRLFRKGVALNRVDTEQDEEREIKLERVNAEDSCREEVLLCTQLGDPFYGT